MKPFRGKAQQLTLFKAPKPTDAHRWPEGYSPERRDDVASRLEITQRGQRNTTDRYTDTRGAGDWINPHISVGQKNVVADVARSSVPIEALQNPARHDRRIGIETRGDLNGGRYSPSTGSIDVGGNAAPHVLLHEIGHSVSMHTDQPHATSGTPEGMGQEEAFADNYAHTHVGARRGEKPEPYKSIYEKGPEGFQQQYDVPRWQAAISHTSYMNARQFATAPSARTGAQMPTHPPHEKGRYWQPELDQP